MHRASCAREGTRETIIIRARKKKLPKKYKWHTRSNHYSHIMYELQNPDLYTYLNVFICRFSDVKVLAIYWGNSVIARISHRRRLQSRPKRITHSTSTVTRHIAAGNDRTRYTHDCFYYRLCSCSSTQTRRQSTANDEGDIVLFRCIPTCVYGVSVYALTNEIGLIEIRGDIKSATIARDERLNFNIHHANELTFFSHAASHYIYYKLREIREKEELGGGGGGDKINNTARENTMTPDENSRSLITLAIVFGNNQSSPRDDDLVCCRYYQQSNQFDCFTTNKVYRDSCQYLAYPRKSRSVRKNDPYFRSDAFVNTRSSRGIIYSAELPRLYTLTSGNLPNLRGIFRGKEIDWLLSEAAMNWKAKPSENSREMDLIRFVASTGYKDEPDVDEDGKPLLRRTTAVHHVVMEETCDSVADLFKIYNRYDVNYTDDSGVTHFHVACEYGCTEVVEKFLELGQNPNCLDYIKGDSPLNYALKNGHKEVMELLLRNGADPNLSNKEGSTPLHIICKKHGCYDDDLDPPFFKIIDEMQKTVQVDAMDELGRTPLQWAVVNLAPTTVKLLFDRGADISKFVFPTESYFAKRFDTMRYRSFHEFKVHLACIALVIVKSLEKRGYKLNRSDALTVMMLFATHEMFEKSTDVEEIWYNEERFAIEAKQHMIKPSLSLYDLIQLRPEEASKQIKYFHYSQFVHSEEYRNLPNMNRRACNLHLCEKLSRRFFQRWALESFLELMRYRLPILCCEKIIMKLKNEDLWCTCLATASQIASRRQQTPLLPLPPLQLHAA
ncbi:unnamed protein product [Trichogramma brassicae]|uniref:Uncharacterized protein n=1 Tax=Trichogramma brassicae TaxID=86971 RepID=A0A6H5IV59_9HYME|nr:unnamed protein product [Trichogramma brassicae]